MVIGWSKDPRRKVKGWSKDEYRNRKVSRRETDTTYSPFTPLPRRSADPEPLGHTKAGDARALYSGWWIEGCSAILKEVASAEGVSYLPLYEQMQKLIPASPGRAFMSCDYLPFCREIFKFTNGLR